MIATGGIWKNSKACASCQDGGTLWMAQGVEGRGTDVTCSLDCIFSHSIVLQFLYPLIY